MKKIIIISSLFLFYSFSSVQIALAESTEYEETQTSQNPITAPTESLSDPSQMEEQYTESSEVSDEAFVPQSELTNEFGSFYLPKGRSDLQPSISLYATLPVVSATNSNTPTKGFIDVSSHNGSISVNQYKSMKNYGVTGVIVKLTEGTTYTNPYAQSQIANAKTAGLKVSVYHYSWFTSDSEARAEAAYFAASAKKFGLSSSTVLVNDIEEPKIAGLGNHTANSKAFENRLKELGFGNVTHYVGLYWLTSGQINATQLGNKNIWVAAYPYTLSKNNLYKEYGAWQWSSQLTFPGISGYFDISADYTGLYTNTEPVAPEGSTAMYRLYNPNTGEHFYTKNSYEKNSLLNVGWLYEGVGWNAPTSGIPVYRLYNQNSGDHHYTLNTNERDMLSSKGWKYEGIGWYSDTKKTVPLYRAYNPNAKTGTHNYTVNRNEQTNLIKNGWRDEGVSWHGK